MELITKILIVEHDQNDIELLQNELTTGGVNYISKVVQNQYDYSNALEYFMPDIILSDYSLPSFDGPEALKMRELLTPDTPFIFVSGTIGEENSIEYIRNGLTDFVLKEKLSTLSVKVIRALKESNEKKRKIKFEKNLKLSELRLNKAQAISHASSWEIDFATETHSWSDELYKIFEVSKDDVTPSSELFLSFIHPEDVDYAQKQIFQSFGKKEISSFNFRYVLNNDSIRHAYAEWNCEFDEEAQPVRLFGILQDITERKISELKLEQQNRDLIKTNSELDRFVYSVSHDLRSPLTSVLGLLNFIEDESKETDTLKFANMIRVSINRLDSFIKNILSYSRNNRTELEVEQIHLKNTLTQIIDSLRDMEDGAGIKFEININEKEVFYSDVQHINIVLENLIGNAIKYHKRDKSDRFIRITGSIDNECMNLTIQDNGIGIADEHHSKIFDMFYRLSGKISGSGIGLYIVKEVISKLQGSIKVLSQIGVGTSFEINIKNMKLIANEQEN